MIERQCDAVRDSGRIVVFMGDRLNRISQLKPAMYIRGMEQIYVDMRENPELAGAILSRIRSFYRAYSERIFEATRRLLTESDLAESFKVVGRQRARKFTWAECAKSTLLAYRAAQESVEKNEEPSLLRALK